MLRLPLLKSFLFPSSNGSQLFSTMSFHLPTQRALVSCLDLPRKWRMAADSTRGQRRAKMWPLTGKEWNFLGLVNSVFTSYFSLFFSLLKYKFYILSPFSFCTDKCPIFFFNSFHLLTSTTINHHTSLNTLLPLFLCYLLYTLLSTFHCVFPFFYPSF